MKRSALIVTLCALVGSTAYAVEVESDPDSVDTGEAQPSIVDEGEPTAAERAEADQRPVPGFPLLTLLPKGSLAPIRLEYREDVVTLDEAQKRALSVVPTILSQYADATVVIEPPRTKAGEPTQTEVAASPLFALRRDRVVQQLEAFGVQDVRIGVLGPAPSNPRRVLPIVIDQDHGPD